MHGVKKPATPTRALVSWRKCIVPTLVSSTTLDITKLISKFELTIANPYPDDGGYKTQYLHTASMVNRSVVGGHVLLLCPLIMYALVASLITITAASTVVLGYSVMRTVLFNMAMVVTHAPGGVPTAGACVGTHDYLASTTT